MKELEILIKRLREMLKSMDEQEFFSSDEAMHSHGGKIVGVEKALKEAEVVWFDARSTELRDWARSHEYVYHANLSDSGIEYSDVVTDTSGIWLVWHNHNEDLRWMPRVRIGHTWQRQLPPV